MNLRITVAAAALSLFATAGVLHAQTLDSALKEGTPSMQLRFSLERADQADNDRDAATALNLRSRLGYRTAPWGDTTAFLQFQDVSAIVPEYAPVDDEFDTVGDPEGTSVHQAYLDWEGIADLRIRAGRQEIVLENGRMFSNANWRQHAQSFDAVLFGNTKPDALRVTVGGVKRVKSPANTVTTLEHLGIVQLDWLSIPAHVIHLHAYLLDAEGDSSTDRDKATYGFRVVGNYPVFEYALDYSFQTDYADNQDDGGSMANAFAAAKLDFVRFGVGYAQLTGQDGRDRPYDTLFSTGHGFQGWTDQFAGTNGGLERGVRETYVVVGGSETAFTWQLRFHQFEQETQSQNYGNEFNILATTDVSENLNLLAKLASYTADDGNDSGVGDKDELVWWLRADYRF